jgi:DNA invertase Pin-like site-specific DNA recombinase
MEEANGKNGKDDTLAHLRGPAEAVLYARVSSDRQAREGDGARSQEQRCRAYAETRGYRVVASFPDEGVSGALVDRPGLVALLQFVRARRDATGREVVVVVDDISRVARDVNAHLQIRAALRAAGGRLESPSFSFGDGAADQFVETILAAAAAFGRSGNREQVLNRMKARLEQGYWPFPAPPGYRVERHPAHKKWLVPTDEARRILGPALCGYATGAFQTQRELALHLREQGFFGDARGTTVSVLEKRVGRMLEAAFLYAGQIEYPAWDVERHEGQHEAIIAAPTLRRIEERLTSPGRPWGARRADAASSALILRGTIRCRGCGRPLTGCLAKGRYPRYHCYYRGCQFRGDSFSANKKVQPAFVELLRSLRPAPELASLIDQQVDRLWEYHVGEEEGARRIAVQELEATRRELEALVRRIARTTSDAVAGQLEREVEALSRREAALTRRIEEVGGDAPDYRAAWEAVHTWFADPAGMWESGSDTQKRTVHRILFTVPPVFDPDRGLHTYDLSLPYRFSEEFKHNKARVVDSTGQNTHAFLTKEVFGCFCDWSSWLEAGLLS